MAKVLVTGGAGFIGSHVLRALLAGGHEAVVLDDFSSGKRAAVPEGVVVMEGDVADMVTVRKAMHGCTHVVHLAALVSVPLSIAEPGRTFRSNVQGMQAVLEAAREVALPGRLVYASSAAVYGALDQTRPAAEGDAEGMKLLSPYAASKAAGEVLGKAYRDVYGLRTTGLRFFNVYGPGQDAANPYSGVLSRVVHCVESDEMFTVFGDGEQTRDFVAVEDVARVVVALVAKEGEIPAVMNLGSGVAVSLLEMLRQVAEVIGKAPQVEHRPVREGDIRRSCADIALLRSVLAEWRPLGLGEGLGKWLLK